MPSALTCSCGEASLLHLLSLSFVLKISFLSEDFRLFWEVGKYVFTCHYFTSPPFSLFVENPFCPLNNLVCSDLWIYVYGFRSMDRFLWICPTYLYFLLALVIAKYTQDELCCLWFDGQSLSAEAGDSQFISLLSWKQIWWLYGIYPFLECIFFVDRF